MGSALFEMVKMKKGAGLWVISTFRPAPGDLPAYLPPRKKGAMGNPLCGGFESPQLLKNPLYYPWNILRFFVLKNPEKAR